MMDVQINDLPSELLTKIFLNLNDNEDRLRVRQVCPLWNSVIEKTVGVSKWIGSGSHLFWENQTLEPLSVLRTIAVAECTFSNVYEVRTDDVYLLPHLMRKATFTGVISPVVFKHLTHPMENLRSVTLDISTLAAFYMPLDSQPLINITSLTLTGGGETLLREWERETALWSYASICNTKFPKLRRFDVKMPYFPRLLDTLISYVKKLLWTRENAEREDVYVSLIFLCSLIENPSDASLDEAFQAVFRGKTQPEELRLFEKGCPGKTTTFQFRDLDMICAFEEFCPSEPLEKVAWTFGTNTFTTVIPVLMTLVLPIRATLTDVRIKLKYPESQDEWVDCSPFSALPHLERLVLKNESESRRCRLHGRRNGAPRILNVSSLPPSLKTIVIGNILMDAKSVDWISKSLPKLETLVLTGIGALRSRGMTIPTLLWVLRENHPVRVLRIEGVNESCRWASLEYHWTHLISPPDCKTCKCPHQSRPWEAVSGHQVVVGKEDRGLLNSLFDHTKHEFRNSIPYILKTSGGWEVMPWDSLPEIMACRI